MNEIQGITIKVDTIDLQDSTDTAEVLTISDGDKTITINICYGKIKQIRCS